VAYNSHMNIFYLDQDVEQAAADHCDKHVVKMIIETAQLLSTAQWFDEAQRRGKLPHQGQISKLWLNMADEDFAAHKVKYEEVQAVFVLQRFLEALAKGGRKFPKKIKRLRVLREFLAVAAPESLYARVYSPTHVNHPSGVWARADLTHYTWLAELGFHLCWEYTKRYQRVHKTKRVIRWLQDNPPQAMPRTQFQAPPQCMPDDCKVPGDCAAAYRTYYKRHKAYMAKWRYSDTPEWW